MKPVDYRAVAAQVYDFATSQSPLAPLVKEALGVIDDAIECFGYVLSCHALSHPARGVAHAARRELTDREKARRLKILADPHALLVDPARALCTRCLFPLALSTHSLYDVGKWKKHRDNCVTWSPARLAHARATNLKERKVRVWCSGRRVHGWS